MNAKTRSAVVLLLSLASAGCREAPAPESPSEAHTDEGHEEHGAHEHGGLPSEVSLPASVLAASGVKLAPVTYEELAPTLDLTGEVRPDPDLAASVAAQVPGRVVAVHFREGQRVRAGAVLAVIESAELARARAAYTAAEARASAARKNARRVEGLTKDGLASGQDVTAANAEAAALEADASAARQVLAAFGAGGLEPSSNPARLSLRAPIEGVVLARDAVIGQTVGAEHVVAHLANLDRAYFEARLFEKNLAAVEKGARADVRLNAYPNEVFTGVVESVGKALDPTARTVVARIVLRNKKDLLKVGLFGKARLVIEGAATGEKRLVVPLSAVTQIGKGDVVFVQEEAGRFEVHPVTLGASAGGMVEVLAGLREGEQVVVEGVFTLKSVALKSTFGEEDHH